MIGLADRSKILLAISLGCFVLLFVGGPGYYASRSLNAAWDLGHIFFFAVLTYLAMQYIHLKTSWTYKRQRLVIVLCGVFFGVLIEIIQSLSAREMSAVDVFNDFTGILLACAFLGPGRKALLKKQLRFLQITSLLALVFGCYPLATVLVDEYIADRQFPLLADFETPFELKRWTADRPYRTIDHTIARHGNTSMKIELDTSQYSGTSLKYFPHDWRGYQALRFSIYNPSEDSLPIHCRVHDKQHDLNGNHYYDRFNTTFTVLPGWNDFKIPLEDIMNAPKNRKMDLNNIRGLGIFVIRQPKPRAIFLDHVRLTP